MADGFISDEEIQKVREASDIVAIFSERTPVKQRGHDFWCCCPLHNEKTPSLKIDAALQLWHCFGCGEGGDVFGFLMKMDELTFPEAVRKLAERAGIQLTLPSGKKSASSSQKNRLKAVCEETAAFYHLQLMRGKTNEADKARKYLSGRKLGGKVPKDWNLGFATGNQALVRHLSSKGFSAKEMVAANVAVEREGRGVRDRFYNRVMFPIRDISGETIAFGGRIMGDGQPKYLNSNENAIFHKSQVLYGLDKAKTGMASTGVAVVVEGYTDVIAMHEAGLNNAVATLGTSLTMQHIRVLSRHAKNKIVYLFDGDAAGQKAADRALGFIDSNMTPEAGKSRVELCAVTLPDNLDPADFIDQRGAQALQELIDTAQPLLQYGIDRRLAQYDLNKPEGRSAAFKAALDVLAPIKDSILAQDYALQIASRCRMREELAIEQLAKLVPPKVYEKDAPEAAPSEAAPVSIPAQTEQPLSVADLTQAELNRLKTERKLLCLAAQHPSFALAHADALAGAKWHGRLNPQLAAGILKVLMDAPDAEAAQVIFTLASEIPAAANALTAVQVEDASTVDSMMSYLAEELAIGDMEDEINELRSQLSHAVGASAEDQEIMFQTVAYMQQELVARKQAHKASL